jgi:hypothetical protein
VVNFLISVQVVWDRDLYSTLLPEVGAAASRFELRVSLQDPLLSQLVTTLADETEDGFADRILVECRAAEVIRAQTGDVGENSEREILIEMRLDERYARRTLALPEGTVLVVRAHPLQN